MAADFARAGAGAGWQHEGERRQSLNVFPQFPSTTVTRCMTWRAPTWHKIAHGDGCRSADPADNRSCQVTTWHAQRVLGVSQQIQTTDILLDGLAARARAGDPAGLDRYRRGDEHFRRSADQIAPGLSDEKQYGVRFDVAQGP
jgi:hypothetical protein